MFRRLRASAMGVALGFAIAAGDVAAAVAERPEPPAAIAQYVETIPTATGSAFTRGSDRRTPVPPSIIAGIRREGAEDTTLLEATVASTRYGAPLRPARPPLAEATTTRAAGPPLEQGVFYRDAGGQGPIASVLGTLASSQTGQVVLGGLVAIAAFLGASGLASRARRPSG